MQSEVIMGFGFVLFATFAVLEVCAVLIVFAV
jgi:hypothetical protein